MDIVQWTDVLGNIGEFVGSLVVLVTLVYLAVQVKQSKELLEENRRIASAQIYAARSNQTIGLMTQDIESPFCTRILAQRRNEDEDTTRTRAYYMRLALQLDCSLYMHELGLLSEEDVMRIRFTVVSQYPIWEELSVMILPRLKRCYEQHKDVEFDHLITRFTN